MNSDAMRQLNMVRFMDWDFQPAAFNVLKNTGIRSTNMAKSSSLLASMSVAVAVSPANLCCVLPVPFTAGVFQKGRRPWATAAEVGSPELHFLWTV